MSQETTTQTISEPEYGSAWKGGVIAGLFGGIVMGIMLTMMMTPVIQHAIPALWGLDGLAAGWIIHLLNSAVFGLIFATLAVAAGVKESVGKSAGLGIAYGVAIWVVAAVIVMPIWLGVVGFPDAPPLPNLNVQSLVGHIVFGVITGAVFPYVRNL